MSDVEEEGTTWNYPEGHDGTDQIAPGAGWEYEPTRRQLRTRMTWHGRLRLALQRFAGSFNRR